MRAPCTDDPRDPWYDATYEPTPASSATFLAVTVDDCEPQIPFGFQIPTRRSTRLRPLSSQARAAARWRNR